MKKKVKNNRGMKKTGGRKLRLFSITVATLIISSMILSMVAVLAQPKIDWSKQSQDQNFQILKIDDENLFQGVIVDNKPAGYGTWTKTITDKQSIRFTGDFQSGTINGEGSADLTFDQMNFTLNGRFKEGKLDGFVKIYDFEGYAMYKQGKLVDVYAPAFDPKRSQLKIKEFESARQNIKSKIEKTDVIHLK